MDIRSPVRAPSGAAAAIVPHVAAAAKPDGVDWSGQGIVGFRGSVKTWDIYRAIRRRSTRVASDGLGAPARMGVRGAMYLCFNCQHPWESTLRQPAVKETCDHCGAYLHCCRNCRFHRKGYPNECYIPDTEKIADKARANFCDEFEFRSPPSDSNSSTGTQDDLAALLGEEDEERTKNEQDSVKEWLTTSDKKVKGFDDLFDE